jgi:hypothetical protein
MTTIKPHVMKKQQTSRSTVTTLSNVIACPALPTVRSKIMKTFAIYICGVGLFCATVRGADITWQAPATISGTSDVSVHGTLVGTWGPGDDWGGLNRSDYYPVNGVTFAAYGSGPFNSFVGSSGLDDRYNGFANPGTGDANYNYLVQTAIYSYGSTISLTWGGLTPGNTYEIEFWVNDGRNSITAERTETLTGGANTSAPLAYGTGPGGTGPGQYILGTFVAEGSGTQNMTLNASGGADIGPSAQINLLQLRDITMKPNVTWQAPVTISGAADVSTLGTYFGSWAPQNGNANTLPVNGVTFQGFSDLPFFTSGPTFDTGYNGYGSPNTSDTNYNALLQFGRYSNEGSTPATFSWSGMTPGKTYLVQIWVNDGRNIGENRSETITGGTNTSAPLSFGSGGTGPGQYIIGTFVANSSGGQTLIITPFSSGANPTPQVNLVQVRDLSSTTALTITSFGISGATLTLKATNGPANGPFVLLQSGDVTTPVSQWTPVLTNSFDGNGFVSLSANAVNPANPRQFYILRTQP